MSEFGGLIRDAREKLGLSPHRVAELIGRGTGIVKAWERGRAVPTDPFVITSLAAVLAVDEARLFRAAGMEPPDRQPTRTIEQELATIAPQRPPVPEPTDSQEAETASRTVITRQESPEPKPLPPAAHAPRHVTPRAAPSQPERPLTRLGEPTPARVEAATPRSYMDDPEERWSYRLRAVWTAAGIVGLAVILLWAGSRALDALGDAWDALLAGL